MQITVHLLAFGEDVPAPVRLVDLPPAQAEDLISSEHAADRDNLLELVFVNGQNDFQPKPIRSVSCGDVVELPDGSLHKVLGVGFEALPNGTDLNSLPRGARASMC